MSATKADFSQAKRDYLPLTVILWAGCCGVGPRRHLRPLITSTLGARPPAPQYHRFEGLRVRTRCDTSDNQRLALTVLMCPQEHSISATLRWSLPVSVRNS